jgi:uncharacterized protein YhjY with autotransporter beta-barrel domain
MATIRRRSWPAGLAAILSWPLGVQAACRTDLQFGFICEPAGPVAVGLVGSTTDTGLRSTIALAVIEDLLESEADETGGGSGDGSRYEVYAAALYGNNDLRGVQTGLGGNTQANIQGVTGSTSHTGGGLIGVTLRGAQYFVGAALDFLQEDTDFKDNAGGRDTDELGFQVYGTYYPMANRRLFLTGSASYTALDIDSNRTFLAIDGAADPLTEIRPSRLNTAHGRTDGSIYSLLGGGGYTWQFQPRTALALSAWLLWQDTSIDGYAESGALPQNNGNDQLRTGNLRYDDDQYTTFDGIVTATLFHTIPIAAGRLVPSASLSYVHEFESDTRNLNAELIDAVESEPGNRFFAVQTHQADTDYLRVGVSLNAEFNRGTKVYVTYQGIAANDQQRENLFGIGLSYSF